MRFGLDNTCPKIFGRKPPFLDPYLSWLELNENKASLKAVILYWDLKIWTSEHFHI